MVFPPPPPNRAAFALKIAKDVAQGSICLADIVKHALREADADTMVKSFSAHFAEMSGADQHSMCVFLHRLTAQAVEHATFGRVL